MIQTDRLFLRRCSQRDVDAVLAYRSRTDVAQHLSSGAWTRAKAERELASYEKADFDGPGDELVLVVETLDDAVVVGEVGLVWHTELPVTAEVGYVFDPKTGGQGFATEAVAAVIRFAFESYSFNAVIATTDEANNSSRALCNRLGMTLISSANSSDGRAVRECVYRIVREHHAD